MVADEDPATGSDDGYDLVGVSPHQVGQFRFYFDDERWEWSDAVQIMHGYEPGTVSPTTELVLSHKHPDDYQQVANTLDDVRRHHKAFSTRHRIVDTTGRIHHVIVVADKLQDASGEVIGTEGFYVDVTPGEDRKQKQFSEAIAEIAENRATIEQAKGMLMVVYGIDSEAAFDLLRWRSQEANIKLRLLADQVVADFVALSQAEVSPPRAAYDNLLLTADRRIGSPQQTQSS
ncbi:ANTAR domain-containing protein [Mycobacterium crocinum]|uniref:PAS and ANTAR domain-containing protein n=1 Tax=Mycolicibacterium crocinum TaxID=388459 RepID=A0ABY3TPG2_9MYCO|nr:PAS and ANTAR domain-containing protein [Mycolicibacterium crocinum]MCV7218908.1 ANTAR domain-containing protein [Mycolicibacterium crocinum]ULN43342.1 PAS and ANTAR domain-containing protein [Mycolicibacterium crocinum]